MDAAEQERMEEHWRREALERRRAQALLDAWVEGQRAAAAEERRFWRERDPFNYGHWN
jgi:hypothetical protein